MNICLCMFLLSLVCGSSFCQVQPPRTVPRLEAEYYVAAYARHYGVPIRFVRAIVGLESGWHPSAISRKGAVGLMQLMPVMAARLGVRDRCSVKDSVSGGVFYLAWLTRRFHGDLRLVAASYIAGEHIIARRGLAYSNPEVVAYVSRIGASYLPRPAGHNQENSAKLARRVIR